jgi:hypothetical protein
VAHYLFNFTGGRERAADLMQRKMWEIGADEPHRGALAAGDHVLIYLAAPERQLIGRAELASSADSRGVLLAQVEEWDPPVPMSAVLSRIESPIARADFDAGVVLITGDEYETALAVAAERSGRLDGVAQADSPGLND